MTDADLVTLMDREANRLETDNDHCAAALMRTAAGRIRAHIAAKPRFYASSLQVGPSEEQIGKAIADQLFPNGNGASA